MSKKTPSQDSNFDLVEKSLQAYREAALSDSYMFGDYNGYEAFKGEDQSSPFFYKYSYTGTRQRNEVVQKFYSRKKER